MKTNLNKEVQEFHLPTSPDLISFPLLKSQEPLVHQFEKQWPLFKRLHTCSEFLLPTIFRLINQEERANTPYDLRFQLEQILGLDWILLALEATFAYEACINWKQKKLTQKEIKQLIVELEQNSNQAKLFSLKEQIEQLVTPMFELEQQSKALKTIQAIFSELPLKMEGDLALLHQQYALKKEKENNKQAFFQKKGDETSLQKREEKLETRFFQERGALSDCYQAILKSYQKKNPEAFAQVVENWNHCGFLSPSIEEELEAIYEQYRHQTGCYQRFSAFFKTYFGKTVDQKRKQVDESFRQAKKEFLNDEANYQQWIQEFEKTNQAEQERKSHLGLLYQALPYFSYLLPLSYGRMYLPQIAKVKEEMTLEEVEELMALVPIPKEEKEKIIS